ncbi:hypothetical protein EUGRSUZ_B01663 [Eucalyptus grandis]|uniref:Uncharacterized protein n=2 Tax=Eucalyptus grandis TaxID=71139 RepID=A0ACC3LR54_EUCGR|nr:hypothetical protein EUGRSUZ_B01663 [Eucalyptus grandis]
MKAWNLFVHDFHFPSRHDCKSTVTHGSISSVSSKRHHSRISTCKQGTLSNEELQALDDIELANVVIFGNKAFRPMQHQACKTSVAKQDCFILMPTGGELPATLKPGVTVVISLLLSLIQDQIVTPEKIVGNPSFLKILKCLHRKAQLAGFVVDETHFNGDMIFRPYYRGLGCLKQNFPYVPVMALTATVTHPVHEDILKALRIPRALVISKTKEPLKQLEELLKNRFANLCRIVYCLSKSECVDVANYLNDKCGIKTVYYHAVLAARQRVAVQKKWHAGEVQVVCAVIAFGMGIDKPDVAGRDNLPAVRIALYAKKDFSRVVCMLRSGQGSKTEIFRSALAQARKISDIVNSRCQLS